MNRRQFMRQNLSRLMGWISEDQFEIVDVPVFSRSVKQPNGRWTCEATGEVRRVVLLKYVKSGWEWTTKLFMWNIKGVKESI